MARELELHERPRLNDGHHIVDLPRRSGAEIGRTGLELDVDAGRDSRGVLVSRSDTINMLTLAATAAHFSARRAS